MDKNKCESHSQLKSGLLSEKYSIESHFPSTSETICKRRRLFWGNGPEISDFVGCMSPEDVGKVLLCKNSSAFIPLDMAQNSVGSSTPMEGSSNPRHGWKPAWKPPRSSYGLIQETLYEDPWKLLISCMLLNKTSGKQMNDVIWDLFELIPTPQAAITVSCDALFEILHPLGLQNIRVDRIKKLSARFVMADWVDVSTLPGVGKYGSDSHAIFCQGNWRDIESSDKMLKLYLKFLRETDGFGLGFCDD